MVLFRALNVGDAARVAPLDKLSVVLVALFGVIPAALGTALGGGATLRQIGALGIYDPATNAIRAGISNVVIE